MLLPFRLFNQRVGQLVKASEGVLRQETQANNATMVIAFRVSGALKVESKRSLFDNRRLGEIATPPSPSNDNTINRAVAKQEVSRVACTLNPVQRPLTVTFPNNLST